VCDQFLDFLKQRAFENSQSLQFFENYAKSDGKVCVEKH